MTPDGTAAKSDHDLVGNYFVSTYPPFSCWTAEETARWREQLEQPPQNERPLGLYLHIPFCAERCQYCYYLSHDDRFSDVDGYLDALAIEMALYSDASALAGRPVDFVYFGGGTPSVLSSSRIRRLVHELQASVPWTSAREVSFECAPKSVTEAKCRVLRDAGVTRLSVGVQQMDDRVLQANGRIHLSADVRRAYEAIRRLGFDVVNLDLMVGLVGETDESFQASLEKVIGLEPDSVTLYQLEIPQNTPLYRQIRDGTQESPPATWDTKRARLALGFARLEQAGYTVRSAYSAVRDPLRHAFVYQDEQYRGADLLGLGVSSFSYVAGVHQQNRASLPAYLDELSHGRLPLGRAHALSEDERLVREVVLQLKLGRLDADRFRAKFGVDILERFAGPLASLADRGYAEVHPDCAVLTRQGLLRVDQLIPLFYLPQHRGVRYS